MTQARGTRGNDYCLMLGSFSDPKDRNFSRKKEVRAIGVLRWFVYQIDGGEPLSIPRRGQGVVESHRLCHGRCPDI